MTILIIRKHKRFAVRREVILHPGDGQSRPGLLVELSLDGCRMGCTAHAEFPVGQSVLLRVDGFRDLAAKVRWSKDGCIGMRFDQPLHNAELDRLIRACRAGYQHDEAQRAYGT